MRQLKPIRSDRLRLLERPYSWVPFRLLSSGLLAELSPPAKLLYFFLCLVANRQGLSCYGDRRIHELLELSDQELSRGRHELYEHDLLAFDGRVYQLLSWPEQPQAEHRAEPKRFAEAGRDASPRRPQDKHPSERAGPKQVLAALQRLEARQR